MKYMVIMLLLSAAQINAQNYIHDKVYTANQVSNTVSVIDASTQKLLGEVSLGKPQPDIFSALYKGQALVHGLGYSPLKKLLAVVSIGSNAVTFISTENDAVLKTIYVGRSPHEATFKPDGKQVWVSVRGESYISVIDADRKEEIKQVPVADGPGMVAFTPDGRWAYVCSSFTPELDIVNTITYKVEKRIPVVSSFSPNIFTSYDGKWVAMTHKDVGKTTVINTATKEIETVINSGPISNHVTFTNTKNPIMLVSVGGENKVKFYDVNNGFKQIDSVETGSLPHGIWTSPDGKFAYVGLENDDKVNVIDIPARKLVATIPIGNAPQALIYAANASTKENAATELLNPLGNSTTQVINMTPKTAGNASGVVVARSIGLADLLQLNFKNLQPNQTYSLALSKNNGDTMDKEGIILSGFTTDANGVYAGQCTGLIKTLNKDEAGNFSYLILYHNSKAELVNK